MQPRTTKLSDDASQDALVVEADPTAPVETAAEAGGADAEPAVADGETPAADAAGGAGGGAAAAPGGGPLPVLGGLAAAGAVGAAVAVGVADDSDGGSGSDTQAGDPTWWQRGLPVPSYAEISAIESTNEFLAINTDPFDGPTAFEQSGLAAALARGIDGTGQIIAVMDDGLQTDHPELIGKIIGTAGQVSIADHGTHVAGIAAARRDGLGMHGVAPAAGLFFTPYENGRDFSPEWWARATDASRQAGAIVQNNSWGWDDDTAVSQALQELRSSSLDPAAFLAEAGRDLGYPAETWSRDDWRAYVDALNRFQRTGVIVWANSNDYTLGDSDTSSSLPLLFPELAEAWVTVANIDVSFAVYGDPSSGFDLERVSAPCGSAAAFCISADGGGFWDQIYSSVPYSTYTGFIGTSMAAPQVAGAVALLAQAFPGHSPEQLRNRLLASAFDDLDEVGLGSEWVTAGVSDFGNGVISAYSTEFGHGFMDVAAALEPIGTVTMRTGENAQSAQRHSVEHSVISLGPAFGDGLATALAGRSVAVFDDLDGAFPVALENFTRVQPARVTLDKRFARFDGHDSDTLIPVPGTAIRFSTAPAASAQPRAVTLTESATAYGEEIVGGYFAFTPGPGHMMEAAYGDEVRTMFTANDAGAAEVAGLAAPDGFMLPWTGFAETRAMATGFRVSDGAAGAWRFGAFYGEPGDDGDPATEDGGDTFGSTVQYRHRVGDGIRVSLLSGAMVENGTVLGSRTQGAFALKRAATTGFLGLGMDFELGSGLSLTGAYHVGWTRAGAADDSMVSDLSTIRSDSFGLALSGDRVFDAQDRWSLSLSQPLRVADAAVGMDVPTGRRPDLSMAHQRLEADLSPSGRALDLGLAYHRMIDGNTHLSAGLIGHMQPDHIREAEPEATALLKLDLAF